MQTGTVFRGGGAHAAVVFEALCATKTLRLEDIFVWDDAPSVHQVLSELKHVRTCEEAQHHAAKYETLEVIVPIGDPKIRASLVDQVRSSFSSPLRFPTIVHTSAYISPSATLGEGVFVGPQAVVHTNARVGSFCIVNSGAIVEHDCILEPFATLNPHSVLGGATTLKRGAVLGLNASVRDHVTVACGVVIGMGGAVVQSQQRENVTLIGVPCKPKMVKRDNSVGPSATAVSWCLKKDFSLARFDAYLKPSVAKGHLTNDGPLQQVAAGKVQALLRTTRPALLASNGTAALHALAAGLEIKLGKRLRWATQAFTFPSSIQGPLCTSIIVDVDKDTLFPHLAELERVADSIDGVVATNVFGLQGGILEMEQWCQARGKLLVFDNAATSFGFLSDGRSIHDAGDGAIVSLHETKPIGRGEGGVVFVSQENMAFVHQAMNFGFDVKAPIHIPHRFASNWRMSDVAAAALCDHWDSVIEQKWIERQKDLLNVVEPLLLSFGFCLLPKPTYPTLVSCLFVRLQKVLTDDQLDNIVARLSRCVPSIEAKRYYRPLAADAATAWEVFRTSICLPFHIGLTKDLIQHSLRSLRVAVDAVTCAEVKTNMAK